MSMHQEYVWSACVGESALETGVVGISVVLPSVWGVSSINYGVRGFSNSSAAVFGERKSSYAPNGVGENSYTVFGISYGHHGAFIMGDKDHGFADIILGASSFTSTGDNGVTMSDPNVPGSDIFMVANDAVIVQIDKNKNTQGNFCCVGWKQHQSRSDNLRWGGNIKGTTIHDSDRNGKEKISDIAYCGVLQTINEMPIYEWQL